MGGYCQYEAAYRERWAMRKNPTLLTRLERGQGKSQLRNHWVLL